jgi:hypothetical protein
MCMLTKKIPFKKHQIIFFFHLTTNSTFDSVQIAIWPYIQFCLGKFSSPRVLKFFSCIMILFLDILT